MMVERAAVICPSCGTRNRPDWEFCARCDESLEGAQPLDDTIPSEQAPTLSVELTPVEGGSSLSGPTVLVVSVLAFGVLGMAAYRHVSTTPPPEGADPNLFTVATRPPEPLEAAPDTTAGADAFVAGSRLLGSGDAQGALSLLTAAVEANPDNAAFRGHLAYALWQTGDQDAALLQYAAAARMDPNRQLQLARALQGAGRDDEAQMEYEAILARSPDGAQPAVHEDLGRLLYRSGRYAEAAPHLTEAVKGRDDDPVLKQELAYALDQQGAREEAEAVYKEVLETAPQAGITRGLLAENLYERGRKEEALSVVQEGLALTPDAPLLRRQMGSLLEREGRRAEAAEAYRAYAELVPNAPDAATMVERASRLEGRGGTR